MISVLTYHCLVTVTFRTTFISLSGLDTCTDAQTNASSRRYYMDTGKGKYDVVMSRQHITGKGNMTRCCFVLL